MNRLAVFDTADLDVVSALVQDAVCTVGDIAYAPSAGTLAMTLNRYRWEGEARSATGERLRSVLHFARVTGLKSAGIDRASPGTVLSLLAVRFVPGAAPSGTVEIAFSGAATLRLDVECLEAALSDTGAAWAAVARPRHDA